MSRTASVVAIVLLVVLPVAGAAGRTYQGAVSGRVLDDAGAPLSAADILLESTTHAITRRTLTDDDGRFLITGVPSGSYTLAASDAVHPLRRFGEFSGAAAGIELMLDGIRVVSDLELRLVRGGTVAGVIRLPGGEPARAAEVALLPIDQPHRESIPLTSTTDSMGRYRIFGIPVGVYTVAARLPLPVAHDTRGDLPIMIVPTLYGGTTDFNVAAAIGVDRVGTVTADITLLTGQAGAVTGAVRGARPIATKSYLVQAVPEVVAPQWWRDALSRTRANDDAGGFAFRDMAPGIYRLTARRLGARWSPADPELLALGATVISAAQHVVTDLPLGPGLAMTGVVECEGRPPSAGVPRAIDLRGVGDIGSVRATVPLEADGQFHIGGLLPGSYIAGVTGPNIRLVQSNVSVDASDVVGLRVRCAPVPSTLSGVVVHANGTPAADVVVVAVMSAPGSTASRPMRVIRPDSRGRYELSDVQWRELTVGVVTFADFMRDSPLAVERVRSAGLAVHLAAGEQRSLMLTSPER